MVVDTIEAAPQVTPEQTPPQTVIANRGVDHEDPSAEVLGLLKEDSAAATAETVPSGGTTPKEETEGLWTAKPEAPAIPASQPEAVVPAVEVTPITDPKPEISMGDSVFTSAVTEKEDEAFGADVAQNFAPAATMIKENAENPNRGIHNQLSKEFSGQTINDTEKGIVAAEEKFGETLERLRRERDELREKAVKKREILSNELNDLIGERQGAEEELKERHAAESKELDDKYNAEIQKRNQDLAEIEQILSEI